jgi:hypothetical protein
MQSKKQVPKTIGSEDDYEKITVYKPDEEGPKRMIVETEEKSPYQTIFELSDDLFTVQCANMIDRTGMGKRSCMLRVINTKSGDLVCTPEILRGFSVVEGILQGE